MAGLQLEPTSQSPGSWLVSCTEEGARKDEMGVTTTSQRLGQQVMRSPLCGSSCWAAWCQGSTCLALPAVSQLGLRTSHLLGQPHPGDMSCRAAAVLTAPVHTDLCPFSGPAALGTRTPPHCPLSGVDDRGDSLPRLLCLGCLWGEQGLPGEQVRAAGASVLLHRADGCRPKGLCEQQQPEQQCQPPERAKLPTPA